MITQEFWYLVLFVDLVILSAVAVYAYYSYYKRLGQLKQIETDSYKKADEIFEEARVKTRQVLETVEQKADEILTHSKLFKTDLEADFKQSLKKLSDGYLNMIQEHSKKFALDYENLLTSVKNESLTKAQASLANIEVEIKKQLDESKAQLAAEMTKSLSKAQEEIKQYKIRELEKIDLEIDDLVVSLAKDLLRINLSPKDHKKLVIQALEKAKEQGLFFL